MQSNDLAQRVQHRRVEKLMGNRFELTAIHEDERVALHAIELAIAEIRRIEELLTTFRDSSQTNRINAAAGIAPVRVDREVFDLVARSLRISKLTQGAFDLSYGSIDRRFWNFDTGMKSLPTKEAAIRSVHQINYRNIILDEKNCTVYLKKEGMRIGFGGIGKGYAADRARMIMQQQGLENGVVNAAGDLCCWGTGPEGNAWTIGIADPDATHHPFSSLELKDAAVATSGNYEKFVIIGGKKYAHTIDPKTGFPVSGIKSVTVICPSAELADAMATPVMVMGIRAGLDLVNQMKDIACILIDDADHVFTTHNIKMT
jgi:thiamine biosynthesis lipoprotein